MKKIIFASLSLMFFTAFSTLSYACHGGEGHETLAIGAKAPLANQSMISTANEIVTLGDALKENGLLVIFSCNTCPFVIYWEDRYPELYEMCRENNLGMIVINSNEAKRDGDDSMEEMQQHAEEQGYEFQYVVDEKSEMANAFGAKTTPHVFLFNEELALEYSGAIDDNYKEKDNVEQPYLQNAILNMANGKKIDPNSTKPIGCSIKRIKL